LSQRTCPYFSRLRPSFFHRPASAHSLSDPMRSLFRPIDRGIFPPFFFFLFLILSLFFFREMLSQAALQLTLLFQDVDGGLFP